MSAIEIEPILNSRANDACSITDADKEFASIAGQLYDTGSLDPCYGDTPVIISPPHSALSSVVRAYEEATLPAVPEHMGPYEDYSYFVAVMQTGEDRLKRPGHVFRIQVIPDDVVVDAPVGLPTFDDALAQGVVTEQQLLDYYQVESLRELGKSYINVESNIAVPEVRSMRTPYGALGYRALFLLYEEINESRNGLVVMQDPAIRGVVAYQNPEAQRALERFGLIPTPLLGDLNLRVVDDDKVKLINEEGFYYPLTVEGVPHSKLPGHIPDHNRRIFEDPEYTREKGSRIARVVAGSSLNLILAS